MSNLTPSDIALMVNEFGKVSFLKLLNVMNRLEDGVLVDIGIYHGTSSKMMLDSATKNRNKIFAIDPIPSFSSNHPNYTYIKGDSVKVGREWDGGEVDLVFFDSVHAKEQVLCELYYWWNLIKEGGVAVLHDTSWDGYVHKEGHVSAGELTGNTKLGHDSYGGVDWETPDKAFETFFNVPINTEQRNIEDDRFITIYEDEFIMVETNYAHLGMTFIHKKQHKQYQDSMTNWDEIFDKRKVLLSFFK